MRYLVNLSSTETAILSALRDGAIIVAVPGAPEPPLTFAEVVRETLPPHRTTVPLRKDGRVVRVVR